MTPVWPVRGDQGVNLTSFPDSKHKGSYYLPKYVKALKAVIKEIKAKTQGKKG